MSRIYYIPLQKGQLILPLLFYCLLTSISDAHVVRHKCYGKGCISKKVTSVGGTELRISHKDFLTLETTVTYYNQTGFLLLREISNGKRLIKTLYNVENDILDCDILNTTKEIRKFWKKFFNRKASNETLHRRIRQWIKHDKVETLSRDDTLKLYKKYFNMLDMKKKCLKFKKEVREEMEHTLFSVNQILYHEKYKNQQPKTVNTSSRESHKTKRSILKSSKRIIREKRSVLIFPGTKWCGKGNTAKHHDDLGENNETDICCRDHDQCPYTVEGFSSKFHLFNYRFYTVSHCECDERFVDFVFFVLMYSKKLR